ncbi:MAG TPA: BlaI/MecI/CopY family transcriptional regulator [Gemmataceae bacterium]|nr:BlaI/MecI/CopY family transcriptional regulator [Gemmataceae bacterium]
MAWPKEPIGRVELDVLKYVADHSPITVRDVAKHFAETSGQARTTLLTVMERLRAKGYLVRRKVAGVHHYTPTIPKADLLLRLVRDFVDDVLGGAVSPFVAFLTQSTHLNESDARKLAKLLKRIELRERKEKP